MMAMLVVGPEVIKRLRELQGDSEPISAGLGTIRQTYSQDSFSQADAANRAIENIIHCSDSLANAKREKRIWFPYFRVN